MFIAVLFYLFFLSQRIKTDEAPVFLKFTEQYSFFFFFFLSYTRDLYMY